MARHNNPHKVGAPQDKVENPSKTLRDLLKKLEPYKVQIVISIIFAIVSTGLAIMGPKISSRITTEIANGILAKIRGTGGIMFDKILIVMKRLTVMYIVSFILDYTQSLMMNRVTQEVASGLRTEITEKINRLPLSYFDTRVHGETLSIVTNDVDTIATSLNQSLSQIISSVTRIIGFLVMMLSISWKMTMIMVITVPVSILFLVLIIKKSQKYHVAHQRYLATLNGHIEESYSGHDVIKAFNFEEQSVNQFMEHNDNLYESGWKSQFLSGLMQPIMNFIGNIGYVLVTLLGGYLAINGEIEVGDIQAFIQYVRNFNQPLAQVAQITNVVQSTLAASERVFDFLEQEEELEDIKEGASIDNIKGEVRFENVKFGYNKDNMIIHDFSAIAKPGQKVAIVGPTGAGKTTMIKLLMRFYELNGGAIYVDGTNITEFKRNDLRSLFGVVLQDAWLFSGTIMENLRYGNLNATDEEVIAAADAAYVDHFIRTLEDGYETVIDEDSSNISQGQKQLLTIARAFLADPTILILDEATSSVDTRTEILIQKGMENLMKGRTSFVIAHRLSTIRDSDVIIVMDQGDVVEVGDHDTLLAQNGFYAQLYHSQFQSESD